MPAGKLLVRDRGPLGGHGRPEGRAIPGTREALRDSHGMYHLSPIWIAGL